MVQQISQSNGHDLSRNGVANLENSLNAKPLALIVNPSEDASAFAGETFELRVTVTNQGNIGAVINIYIDETSGLLRQWCSSAYESLALANNCSAEVVFRFAIPINAASENYSYLLVIDAPKHYPEDTPIHHEARLQVLPPVQSAVRVNDPTFTIFPTTSASQPTTVQPGQPLDLKIIVNNRSSRVDRFRLTCSDLPLEWFTAIYPERLTELGLVGERESLALNPSAKGEIFLRLQFPPNVTAGNYSPTIRLTSLNDLNLVLIDVVYLQVLSIYKLVPELQTMIGKVGQETGWFRLLLGNAGNTLRDISFTVQEDAGKPICTYTFAPEQVKLGAQLRTQTDLRVKPNKWWRRPWFGKGLPIQFYVEISDTYQLPIPDRLEGTLIWEARPLWQFILLMFIAVGAIASLVFAIWWVFFRPPTPPKIIEFASVAPTYEEAAKDAVHLNWQIRQPQQLKAIKIVGIAADSGIVASSTVSYDFSRGIPSELKAFCTLESVLNCQKVRTDAQQAGNYIFQMEIFSKKGDRLADSQKTNTIRINAFPQPKIVELTSTQPTYQAAGPNQVVLTPNNEIALNWKITNPEKLQELKLIGRATDGTIFIPLKTYNFRNGIPLQLRQSCSLNSELICRKVLTNGRKTGNYIFELSAVSKDAVGETSITKKSDTIRVKPYVFPVKILSFLVNGQEALPKYILPVTPEKKAIIFRFDWKVEGSRNTKVELLPAPGTVALEGSIFYPITQQPGVEIITLMVKGELGEQLSRSVAIEKVVLPLPQPIKTKEKRLPSSPLVPKNSVGKRTPALAPSNVPITPTQPNKTTSKTLPSPLPLPNPDKLNTSTPPPRISPSPHGENPLVQTSPVSSSPMELPTCGDLQYQGYSILKSCSSLSKPKEHSF